MDRWGQLERGRYFKAIAFSGLCLIALFVHIASYNYLFGIEFMFVSIIFYIMMHCFSTRATFIAALIIHCIGVLIFDVPMIQGLFIIELLVIKCVESKFPQFNSINTDIVFWLIVGMPLYFKVYGGYLGGEETTYRDLYIMVFMINSVTNIWIGNMLVTYGPIIKKSIATRKVIGIVPLEPLLFHMMIAVITIPSISNIFTSTNNFHQSTLNQVEQMSISIHDQVEQKVQEWNTSEHQKFMLYDVLQRTYMEETIKKVSLTYEYHVIVTNMNNDILVSTSPEYRHKDKYESKEDRRLEIMQLNEAIYKVVPHIKNLSVDTTMEASSYYITQKMVEEKGIYIYVEVPTQQFNKGSIEVYNNQLKMLIYFWTFIGLLYLALHRIVFKNLSKLAVTTANLPNYLEDVEHLAWPQCYIGELDYLGQNFKRMAYKLKEMFEDTKLLNEELKKQSEVLQISKNKLHTLAYYDQLTNVGNRLRFKRRIAKIQSGIIRVKPLLGVILIDMNRFKQINDTLGHEAGDILLEAIAGRLLLIETYETQIFRLGGDEFIILTEQETIEGIEQIALEVRKVFDDPCCIQEANVKVGGSIGISVYPKDSPDLDVVVKYADMAMYHAKEKGDDKVQFFNQSIKEEFGRQLLIEKNMQMALEENAFELYYQPKFRLDTMKITSLEALIRWENEELGSISPSVFIPIAEETGMILKIDRWVIRRACMQLKAWELAGYEVVPIAINISPKYLCHPDFLLSAKSIIQEVGVNPGLLIFEITERLPVKDAEYVAPVIMELNKIGVKVSLDDFGQGYSSLNQVLTLPLHELKIDRDFIQNVHQNDKKELVVKLIIELAHSLNLKVVAEGIETLEELMYMKTTGCDEVQGYLLSRPLTDKKLREILVKKR